MIKKNYATGDSIFHDFWLRLSYESKLGQQLPHDTIKKPKWGDHNLIHWIISSEY
jgi:hypothetical protein